MKLRCIQQRICSYDVSDFLDLSSWDLVDATGSHRIKSLQMDPQAISDLAKIDCELQRTAGDNTNLKNPVICGVCCFAVSCRFPEARATPAFHDHKTVL